MKRHSKKPKKQLIKDLAEQLGSEFDKQLPVTVLPNGDTVYKTFVIKQTKQGNWGIYHLAHKDLVEQYFLKSCALMAAKAYSNTNIDKFFEIKRLDNQYWASHSDTMVYKHNIKITKDFDRYLVLLNKLEQSSARAEHCKEEISRMFKWSFV